jgi:hopanoid-associated phosphorylase
VSFGIAGALAPDLAPGDCVIASRIVFGDDSLDCDAGWLRAVAALLPGPRRGTIAGSASILVNAAQKAALFERTGALAVDMESHLAAQAAKDRGLPFIAIRTISDGAQRALPPAARDALRPDGSLDGVRIARSLLKRPQQIPALIRTGRESERAFATLVRVRAALGPRLCFPDPG